MKEKESGEFTQSSRQSSRDLHHKNDARETERERESRSPDHIELHEEQ